MAYLKSLGILRLVSEQKDHEARGWWNKNVFWLRSSLGREGLSRFFLEEYKPTPIVAPWAGGSGFFNKDNRKAVDALKESKSPRVGSYAAVIRNVQAIIKEEKIAEKPRDDDKTRLIRRYRSELSDEVVEWIDAAMVLQEDGQNFAPLLGTGGNDGRLDFSQNFMQRIVLLGLHTSKPATDGAPLIENALFATPARLIFASVGQFAPGRAGGPNATQGMEGDSIDNPWDFILMIEGALLFAGAAVRRLSAGGSTRASFPFTVRAVGAGFTSAAAEDESESRGELWLPLWRRPMSAIELRQLFGEARAEVGGRPARNGTDFARAVVGLGVDRGITEFARFGFLKRSGKAFLAAPLGRFEVTARPATDLLRQADVWLDHLRSACYAKGAPPRLLSALRRIDSAIFEFCKYEGTTRFQEVLLALGGTERALSRADRFRDEHKLRPLSGLSPEWVAAADDGSPEFAIARGLASVYDAKIGPLRVNLESVDWKRRFNNWAEKDRAVTWNSAHLTTNLASVLQRRLLDGERAGCEHLPLGSNITVSLGAVAAFIAGDLNDNRTEEMIWALMLIDRRRTGSQITQYDEGAVVERAYALLKLLFLPRPLVLQRGKGSALFARLSRDNEVGKVIRPEPSILPLLRAGHVGEACAIAMRRLRASGLEPMPAPVQGHPVRDREWCELGSPASAGGGDRSAAALLIPISDDAISRLVRLILHVDKPDQPSPYHLTQQTREGE